MCNWTRRLLWTLVPAVACATTLIQLSLTDMIRQSTSIVRAKVTGSMGVYKGSDIYTHYQLQVIESLKAATGSTMDVAVPGGSVSAERQAVAGAPRLVPGQEYVLFLWQGKSPMTQVIGLSQGVFAVQTSAAGDPVLVRPGATEMMVDSSGRLVKDQPFSISLSDLRSKISQVLGAGK